MTRVLRGGAPSTLAVTAALLIAACGQPDPGRDEDHRVRDAVERLRSSASGTTERRRLVGTLRGLTPRSSIATEAQRTCAAAYAELCDAEDAISRAEGLMKQAQPSAELPEPLLTEVARAEELLRKAKAALPECDAAAARLALHLR